MLYQEQSGVENSARPCPQPGKNCSLSIPRVGPRAHFWGRGEVLPIWERQYKDNMDDFKLWICHEKSLETVAYSSLEKKKMKEFLKVEKNGLSSCFYLQQVSTADWASPLVLVVAPPPWEPPQGCLLGEKHSAAVAVLLALSPAAQQL